MTESKRQGYSGTGVRGSCSSPTRIPSTTVLQQRDLTLVLLGAGTLVRL